MLDQAMEALYASDFSDTIKGYILFPTNEITSCFCVFII